MIWKSSMRQHKVPIRTCAACRSTSEKKSLLRVVRTCEGGVVVDPTGKLPGRGAYVCASEECVRKAVKEKRLARALRSEIPESAIREIEEVVEQGSNTM